MTQNEYNNNNKKRGDVKYLKKTTITWDKNTLSKLT